MTLVKSVESRLLVQEGGEKKVDFKVGDKVHGKIDWERRYSTMKLHSASHIMRTAPPPSIR